MISGLNLQTNHKKEILMDNSFRIIKTFDVDFVPVFKNEADV